MSGSQVQISNSGFNNNLKEKAHKNDILNKDTSSSLSNRSASDDSFSGSEGLT
jgi:hypothetical protein